MKKTLLAIALFMASTCAFAQVNNVANNKDIDVAPMKIMKNGAQKVAGAKDSRIAKSVKAAPEGAIDLIDFSDASTYEFGTMANHTATDWHWVLQPDTNSIPEETYYFFVTFMQMTNSVAWKNTWFCSYDQVGLSAENGLALICPLGAQDNAQNTTFNAWIKATTPVSTYGMAGIDINFGEYTQPFNQDRYFIDWSHDANFTTYDSIEFHTRNIQLGTNEISRAWTTVHIPNGTTIPVISTTPNEMTYFRIRYYSPAQDMTNGYFWMIDNISYSETPATRLVSYGDAASEYVNAYSMIPAGLTPDEFYRQRIVANTGVDSLANITLVSEFQAVSRNEDNTSYVYTLKGQSETPDTAKLFLSQYPYLGSFLQGGDTLRVYRQEYNLSAYSAPQYVDAEEATYLVRTYMTYVDAVTQEQNSIEVDTIDYVVEGESVTIPNHYRWGRDMNALVNFAGGYTCGINEQGYTTSKANYRTAGYKVCVGYTAGELETPMYARGVELVPAMDSCRNNPVIKASLMVSNPEAQTYDEFVTTAVDEDGNAVESFDFTVTDAYLNNSATPGEGEAMYETERQLNNGGTSRAYNKIYLEYTYGATPIEAGKTYYACYELVENGRFLVGQDYSYWDRFSTGSNLNLLVFNPGQNTNYTYSWGGSYMSASISEYCAPMIRLMISPEASSIKDADKENSSINVYPNPATSQVSVSYVLAQRGEATITVTDLMGRVVYTRPEGMKEAGIANIADINVAGLENGTYFCTLNVNGTATTTKLVVNK